ncbi:hypothetical protein HLRTI_000380 [Halorhabdus tiamatea SARL4B]|uniref:Uncharacterized protein n=1 Tax=Halorhabdus tiamatea SARL4B TaxID=1033806 RepID=F7PK92_9EURY|nr:hypothetical protein [Halorhabdus tiamatea]ERJ07627.1 hypothetical protein HLRTI_000380 [Halorhabdus tiamatea SARL4B]CCQ33421.1 hypothetical protein HTIA_1287 [Halorhabdus tiamatea SARL4B]
MITLSIVSFLERLLGSIGEMPFRFADVVTHDPISAVLVGIGALVMTLTLGTGAYLTLGAVVDFVTPS